MVMVRPVKIMLRKIVNCQYVEGMMNTKKSGNLLIIVILSVTGVIFFGRPVLGDGWEEVTPTGETPGARYGHSTTKVGSDFFVFGGSVSQSGPELSDLWAFNVSNGEWEEKAPKNNPPPPRKNHCAFEYQGSLVITAGDQAGVPVALAFHKYDPLENTWETIHPAGETLATEKLADLGEYEGPRYGHQSVTMGSDVLIGGGNGSPWGYHSGNLVYHTDGGTWDIVDWKPKAGFAGFNQVMLRMYSTML